jgi:hypothetical protein
MPRFAGGLPISSHPSSRQDRLSQRQEPPLATIEQAASGLRPAPNRLSDRLGAAAVQGAKLPGDGVDLLWRKVDLLDPDKPPLLM